MFAILDVSPAAVAPCDVLPSRHPDLLNHHEQMLWKLIQQNQYVWPRYGDEQPLANLNIGRLGMHWDKFVAVADDKAGKSILPD